MYNRAMHAMLKLLNVDGEVVVHFIQINGPSTFNECAEEIFIAWLKKQIQY